MKKIIAGAVAAVAIAATVPFVASAGHGEHQGHGMKGHHGERHGGHGERHGGPRARIRLMEMIGTYDADGDGSVTQEEVDEWRAERLREFDTDGDGELSLDEYEALWLDSMRERMVRHFQRHDRDGDGQVTVDEFGRSTAHLVMMRDRNEDGVLNLDDMRHGRRGGGPQMMMPRAERGATAPGTATERPGASDAPTVPGAETQPAAPAQQ